MVGSSKPCIPRGSSRQRERLLKYTEFSFRQGVRREGRSTVRQVVCVLSRRQREGQGGPGPGFLDWKQDGLGLLLSCERGSPGYSDERTANCGQGDLGDPRLSEAAQVSELGC